MEKIESLRKEFHNEPYARFFGFQLEELRKDTRELPWR